MKQLLIPVLASALIMPGAVLAHGKVLHPEAAATAPVTAEQKEYGIAGAARDAKRTITFAMTDAMRFDPAEVRVALGETVRFRVHNDGAQMHELVIGTMDELQEHAALMRRFPDMQHDEPHMAHVQPGQTQEIVWHFNRPGDFHFACLIAGHMEAGMVGRIVVTAP